MSATTVVNIRFGGPYVYVGRRGRGEDGYYGNPFGREAGAGVTNEHGRELDALELFEFYFLGRVDKDPVFRKRVLVELRGRALGCFCVNQAGEGRCHGKIIAAWIDAAPARWEAHYEKCATCTRRSVPPEPRCERGTQLELEAQPNYGNESLYDAGLADRYGDD